MELYSHIISNHRIIETLFHLDNYDLIVINSTKRMIIKYCPFNHIYEYLPFLKDILNDDKDISYIIMETYENNSILYEISLNKHHLFNDYEYIYNFRFYIQISNDKFNKNKINIQIKTNKIDINEPNPIHQTIIHIIFNYLENEHINYIKNEIIEKELKPLLLSLNPRSFELNII
jgi:hypothetical protein